MPEPSANDNRASGSENSNRARDHLANERTFLAWVRTGIAIVVFGFAIGRFAIAIRAIHADSRSRLADGRTFRLVRHDRDYCGSAIDTRRLASLPPDACSVGIRNSSSRLVLSSIWWEFSWRCSVWRWPAIWFI